MGYSRNTRDQVSGRGGPRGRTRTGHQKRKGHCNEWPFFRSMTVPTVVTRAAVTFVRGSVFISPTLVYIFTIVRFEANVNIGWVLF